MIIQNFKFLFNYKFLLYLDHPDFLFGLLEKYKCAPEYYELPSIDDAAKLDTSQWK